MFHTHNVFKIRCKHRHFLKQTPFYPLNTQGLSPIDNQLLTTTLYGQEINYLLIRQTLTNTLKKRYFTPRITQLLAYT